MNFRDDLYFSIELFSKLLQANVKGIESLEQVVAYTINNVLVKSLSDKQRTC